MSPPENCNIPGLLFVDVDSFQGIITIHTFLARDWNDFIVTGVTTSRAVFKKSMVIVC